MPLEIGVWVLGVTGIGYVCIYIYIRKTRSHYWRLCETGDWRLGTEVWVRKLGKPRVLGLGGIRDWGLVLGLQGRVWDWEMGRKETPQY